MRPTRSPHPRFFLTSLAAALVFLLAGCGGGGGEGGGFVDPITAAPPSSLDQAGYRPGTTEYQYGYASLPNIPIAGAPTDADFSRWAMLHDGATYHLFCFAEGADNTLYRFGFNDSTRTYEFGYGGPSVYGITDIPAAADPSSIGMLHDGRDYRLYMRGLSDRTQLFQFGLDPSTNEFRYGFRSISVIATTGLPADADLERWGMLHDGTTYRQYVGVTGAPDAMYQFGFDGRTYAYGYSSIPRLSIVDMPETSLRSSFALLHDGTTYRFYHLAE